MTIISFYATINLQHKDRGGITSSYLNTTSGGASALSYRYQYDNYGNRTAKTYYYGSNIIQSYEWERGRLLKNIKNTSGGVVGAYTYDVNGVRYTKTADGVTTTYFYDGNTLLGENRSDGTRLRYFYDATGICGFSYYNGSDTKYYTYVKDVLGNIVMIKDDMGLPLVKYTYNEWGVCSMTAFNLDNQGAAALELGNLNPFRYRGYYYDAESKLYYLMSRYYDPSVGQFISPDTRQALKPNRIGGVDLYCYAYNNPVLMNYNPLGMGGGSIASEIVQKTSSLVSKNVSSVPKWIDTLSIAIDHSFSIINPIRTAIAINEYEHLWDLMRLDGVTELPGLLSKVATGVGWGLGIISGSIAGYEKYASGASLFSSLVGGIINASINIGGMYVATGLASLGMEVLTAVGALGGIVVVAGAVGAIIIGVAINHLFTKLEIGGNTIEEHLNNFF